MGYTYQNVEIDEVEHSGDITEFIEIYNSTIRDIWEYVFDCFEARQIPNCSEIETDAPEGFVYSIFSQKISSNINRIFGDAMKAGKDVSSWGMGGIESTEGEVLILPNIFDFRGVEVDGATVNLLDVFEVEIPVKAEVLEKVHLCKLSYDFERNQVNIELRFRSEFEESIPEYLIVDFLEFEGSKEETAAFILSNLGLNAAPIQVAMGQRPACLLPFGDVLVEDIVSEQFDVSTMVWSESGEVVLYNTDWVSEDDLQLEGDKPHVDSADRVGFKLGYPDYAVDAFMNGRLLGTKSKMKLHYGILEGKYDEDDLVAYNLVDFVVNPSDIDKAIERGYEVLEVLEVFEGKYGVELDGYTDPSKYTTDLFDSVEEFRAIVEGDDK